MRFIQLLFIAFCTLASGFQLTAAEAKPNVVIIFIDDQGYYDLGCYGATEVQTPRIDQLAKEGIRFTDYYAAAPICSPSRAGLLTGAYPRRIGMETWVQRADSNRGIHPDEVTIAELFKANGYATGCVGKWHIGDKDPFVPMAQGFDFHYGMYSNLDPVETVYFGDEGVPILRNGEVVKRPAVPAELTNLYTEEAISFVERNKDRPFFLYLPHTMLHVPLGVSPKFQGSSKWGEYGDAIQELDHGVGRLMDSLQALGLDEKTIVVYSSDNGRGPGRTKDQPLIGRKISTWEGGIRVPAILRAPGQKVVQGKVCGEVVNALDWLPTLATAAGIRVPEDHPIIDGRDLWPMMIGETEGIPAPSANLSLNADVPLRRRWEQGLEWQPYFDRDDYLNAYFYHGSHGALAAVRSGQYKAMLNPTLTIYDLENDPKESKPVRNRELNRKLRGMVVMFQEEMSRDARKAGEVKLPAATAPVVRLWPIERIGGEENRLKEEYRTRGQRKQLCGVKDPNLTFYPVNSDNPAKPTPAVIYSPGGGYGVLGLPDEAQIKAWNELGITLIVLKYTIPKQYDAAFQDIQRAVRTVRHEAATWNIDPNRIGLFGNSAGGHLSARLMHNYDQAAYDPVDEIDKQSCKPNFAVLQCSAYFNGIPVGKATELDRNYFHLKNKVAPTFLTYAKDDVHYPGGQNYTKAMNKAGSPIHFEIFEKGGHGMKNCDWFGAASRWLKENKLID